MKIKLFIILSTLIALAVLGFTGCATTPAGSGSSGTNQVQITSNQVYKASILLKGTVRSALILVIDKNGSNAAPYISLAASTLSEFIASGNNSPDALLAALNKLPAKALQKPEVQLAVSTVVTAYEVYYGDYVRNQVDGNNIATSLLTAIRDGCLGALAATASPASP